MELLWLNHVGLNGGKHDGTAKAEQDSSESGEERVECDRVANGQSGGYLSHSLNEYQETSYAGENHGAHGYGPKVLRRAEHGYGTHYGAYDERVFTCVQHKVTQQTGYVLRGEK